MSNSLEKLADSDRPKIEGQPGEPEPDKFPQGEILSAIGDAENLLVDFEGQGENFLRKNAGEGTVGNPAAQAAIKEKVSGFSQRAKAAFRNFVMAVVASGLMSMGPGSAHAALFVDGKATGGARKETKNLSDYIKELPAAASKFSHDVSLAIEGAKLFVEMKYYAGTRENEKMSPEEIEFRERIAQNISNVSYDAISPLQRTEDFLKNERPYSKEKMEKCDKWKQIRVDLFRKYLGLEPFGNFIEESAHKPGKSENKNARYLAFNNQDLLNDIKENWKREVSGDIRDFDSFVTEANPGISHDHFGNVGNSYFGHLGTFKIDAGYDEERKERYISYYDKWDLESPRLKSFGIDLDSMNFPFEVYGRIYESDLKNMK